jgi:hypothetical protein
VSWPQLDFTFPLVRASPAPRSWLHSSPSELTAWAGWCGQVVYLRGNGYGRAGPGSAHMRVHALSRCLIPAPHIVVFARSDQGITSLEGGPGSDSPEAGLPGPPQ